MLLFSVNKLLKNTLNRVRTLEKNFLYAHQNPHVVGHVYIKSIHSWKLNDCVRGRLYVYVGAYDGVENVAGVNETQ